MTRVRPSPPHHVLLLIDDLSCGGAQQLVVSFGAELARRGYSCLVCSLHPETDVAARLEGTGVTLVCLGTPRPSIINPWRFARYVCSCLTAICRIIRREGIDIVHAHLSDAEFLGITAGRLCRVGRVLVTVHSQRPLPPGRAGQWRGKWRIRLTRFLFDRADAVVGVSRETTAMLRDFFGVRPDKLHVIVNGIDTRSPGPASTDAIPRSGGHPILCTVGRLVPQKNQAILMPVMARLRRQGLSPRLLVLGEGELRPELTRARDAAGLTDYVTFLGHRDDVTAVLTQSDIFILPSHYEGTSMALLEAMAAGIPIVASDIPGNREILRQGETALLCPPRDDTAFVAAIRRLTDDPELARSLAAAARRDVQEHYSIKGMTDAYIALWNAIRS